MNRRHFIETMGVTIAGVAAGGAASLLAGGNAAAAVPQAGTDGCKLSAYSLTPGGGLSLPDYYRTTPSVRNRSTYFPGTEELGKDEMRVTFMGSTGGCDLKRNQASMSIYVQLGNGDAFIFDLGIGTFKNYVAMQVPIPKIDHIFLTHLHADHFADLIPVYCFGPLYGRFLPMQVYGPSGRTKQDGTAWFCEKLMEMTHWCADSFKTMEAAVRQLPETVYRVKGIVHAEEQPEREVILQAVGRRADMAPAGFWGEYKPATRIVVIGARGALDVAALRKLFDGCATAVLNFC